MDTLIALMILVGGPLFVIVMFISWYFDFKKSREAKNTYEITKRQSSSLKSEIESLVNSNISKLKISFDEICNNPEYKKDSSCVANSVPVTLSGECVSSYNKDRQRFDFWKNEKNLCCVTNFSNLKNFILRKGDYARSLEVITESEFNKVRREINLSIKSFYIPLDNIDYFNITGQKYTTQEISGGGGTVGGSSLTGAVVGGVVAGGVGAIIGSRKKGTIAPIKTKTTMHDETKCIIKYRNTKGELCEITSEDSQAFYDALKQVIPEKEYSYVIAKKQVQPQMPVQTEAKEEQNKVEERLLKLKKLLEQGLITEEEFSNKRKKILDEI